MYLLIIIMLFVNLSSSRENPNNIAQLEAKAKQLEEKVERRGRLEDDAYHKLERYDATANSSVKYKKPVFNADGSPIIEDPFPEGQSVSERLNLATEAQAKSTKRQEAEDELTTAQNELEAAKQRQKDS